MRLKSLILVATLLTSASCTAGTASSAGSTSNDGGDKFVATATKDNVSDYLTYSYSYTESKTSDNKVQFNVTANFANIDDAYYYVNLKIKFRGGNDVYTIPKSGVATFNYTRLTVDNPSDAVVTIARSGLGVYDIQSGSIYLKAK